MPATQLQVQFLQVTVLDDDSWGKVDWSFKATVGGTEIGDTNEVYEVATHDVVVVNRSIDVDVTGYSYGEDLLITFEATEVGTLWDTSKGMVTLKLHYPFENDVDVYLDGTDEGLVFEQRHYSVHVKVTVLAGFSAPPDPAIPPVPLPGGAPGDDFTVIDGSAIPPRVEVHPVVPLPSSDQLPPRPPSKPGMAAGQTTRFVTAIPLTGSVAPNALPNPSLIPILDPSDADFASHVSRLAVTYIQPKDIDTRKITWHVKKGPVAFHGGSTGLSVLAYATADSPSLVEVELRWGGASGPALCLFRAFVGYIKRIPFRANIICGATLQPQVTHADVTRHVKDANALLFQSGLLLVPDRNATAFDGAVPSAAHPGVYVVNTTDGMTVRVPREAPPQAMRLNWNPGTMNLLYICSFDRGSAAGVATDRPGLPGGSVEVGGTPSSSWVYPTGVKPDDDAETVEMVSMDASDVRTGADDVSYVKSRGLPEDSLSRMWGVTLPDYTTPADPDWGQTVAHEVGHVLGLRHRGNGGNRKDSHDGVNDRHGKGHPFKENVMAYGYALAQDLDLVQTKCVRRHAIFAVPIPAPAPGVTPPAPPPPAPAAPPVPEPASEVSLKELQRALGDSPVNGVWSASTERLAISKMVSKGSKGSVVEWVQKAVNAKGFDCGAADSDFGSKTDAAVRAYQRSVGLRDDGDAGPLTLKQLAGVT